MGEFSTLSQHSLRMAFTIGDVFSGHFSTKELYNSIYKKFELTRKYMEFFQGGWEPLQI
nr:MAG TPA: hypothetical protein [Caudoviricetes sp.]